MNNVPLLNDKIERLQEKELKILVNDFEKNFIEVTEQEEDFDLDDYDSKPVAMDFYNYLLINKRIIPYDKVVECLRKFQDKIIREIKFNEKWKNKHEIIIFNQFLDYFNEVFGVLPENKESDK